MPSEVLIIGRERDYCRVIQEFLEMRDIAVTVLTDLETGMERLFDEKPELSIIEATNGGISPELMAKITASEVFGVPDFMSENPGEPGTPRVLIFDDTSKINGLFDYLKSAVPEVKHNSGPEVVLENGSLESTFYPFVLIEIYRGQRTGILNISSDSELRIYFQNGSPVYAEGGERDTLIGRVLLNTGKIDPDTHKEVLERSKDEKKRVGDVLVESGWVTPHEMNSYLEIQIEERVMRGFCSLSGQYSFSEDFEPPGGLIEQSVKLPKVINEAVKRFIYAEKIEEINPRIKLSKNPDTVINSFELKPKELRMLQLLKNDMEVGEILSQTMLENYEALKLLYLLGLFGAIELPGVSLESIGRKSIERHLNENRMTAGSSHEEAELDDSEEIVELEQEVYESELGAEGGDYESDAEPHEAAEPDISQSDEQVITEELVPEDIREDEAASEETAPENIELFQAGASKPEEEVEQEEVNPISEESVLSPENIDLGNEGEEETSESADSGIGLGVVSNENIEESLSIEDSKEIEIPEEDLSVEAGADPGFDNASSQEAPKEISIDDGELFSTFEQKEYGFEEDREPEPVDAAEISEETPSEDIHGDSSDELSQRIIDFHGAIAEKDYYGILGVSEDAGEEEIRDAYYTLVKDYHPDVNQNIPEDIREKAQEIFTAVNSAYETLSDSDRRESYNSQEEISELKTQAQSIYEAEVEYKRGIVLLVQRDYEEAASKLGEALSMNPGESAYIGAHAWAKFLATDDRNGRTQDLIGDLKRAIEINPDIAENYFYLASIHKSLGDTRMAEENYAKALEVDPHYIEAKRELRLINTRKRKSTKTSKDTKIEKRFWSGLFKK